MIPALIVRPITRESDIKRPPRKRIIRKLAPQTPQAVDDSLRDEETYIFKLLAWFFVLLILPAILTLLYIAVNPDAFMIEITPNTDFSTWQPGQWP